MSTFLTWKRELDALKAEARARTYVDPKPNAALETLLREGLTKPMTAWMPDVRRAAQAGDLALGAPLPPSRALHGWHVQLSRWQAPDGAFVWNFSAKSLPPGRHPTERDVQMLKKIAAHVGAPAGAIYVPTDPSDAFHWAWSESEQLN